MWPIWTISCSVAQSAHRLHVTLASKPPKRHRHQLLFRERKRRVQLPQPLPPLLEQSRARFPASRVVVADCRVPPTKLAHHHLPLLPPVVAASSATSCRGRRLLYSRAALMASCSRHPDSLPGMSNGGQIPSPYSQIQGDGTPHLSKPP
jgi:hypothetical protein